MNGTKGKFYFFFGSHKPVAFNPESCCYVIELVTRRKERKKVRQLIGGTCMLLNIVLHLGKDCGT